MVRGYHRKSRAVAASVADHLKMSKINMVKILRAVERLAKHCFHRCI